jgi:hypothetical protein
LPISNNFAPFAKIGRGRLEPPPFAVADKAGPDHNRRKKEVMGRKAALA